jgi:hydrogenase nickel incorporation protein HypB
MFKRARHVVMTKTDLLAHVPFDIHEAMANALRVNPELSFFEVSAIRSWGLRDWFDFLRHVTARQPAGA